MPSRVLTFELNIRINHNGVSARMNNLSETFLDRKNLEQFIYGALVGTAPMWFILYIILSMNLRADINVSSFIFFISTIIFGALASFLVSRNTDLEGQSVAVVTALMCYLFLVIIFMVFSFQGDFLEETSAFTGYLIGSAIGPKLWENVGEEYEYIEVDEDFNEDDLNTEEE